MKRPDFCPLVFLHLDVPRGGEVDGVSTSAPCVGRDEMTSRKPRHAVEGVDQGAVGVAAERIHRTVGALGLASYGKRCVSPLFNHYMERYRH